MSPQGDNRLRPYLYVSQTRHHGKVNYGSCSKNYFSFRELVEDSPGYPERRKSS